MEQDLQKLEFQLIMQKNIKNFCEKAKLKEENYNKVKQKFCDSLENYENFPLEEEKNNADITENPEDSLPLFLKSEFMRNIASKESFEKSKTNDNMVFSEYTIKNLNTGESYDIRNQQMVDNLTSKSKQVIDINKEKAWQDYWYRKSSKNIIKYFL